MTLFIVGAAILLVGVVIGFALAILSIGLCRKNTDADKPK